MCIVPLVFWVATTSRLYFKTTSPTMLFQIPSSFVSILCLPFGVHHREQNIKKHISFNVHYIKIVWKKICFPKWQFPKYTSFSPIVLHPIDVVLTIPPHLVNVLPFPTSLLCLTFLEELRSQFYPF